MRFPSCFKITFLLASLLNVARTAYVPYIPEGGIETNSTSPVYHALSDFDWQSIVRDFGHKPLLQLDKPTPLVEPGIES